MRHATHNQSSNMTIAVIRSFRTNTSQQSRSNAFSSVILHVIDSPVTNGTTVQMRHHSDGAATPTTILHPIIDALRSSEGD